MCLADLMTLRRSDLVVLARYATLEHAGGFGASGPKGGLELGLNSFMSNCHHSLLPTTLRLRELRKLH